MAKRMMVSAIVALALTFSPSLAFSVPTMSVKKPSAKTKSGHYHKHKTYKHYSRRHARVEVVESSMAPSSSSWIAETPPLMKVVPQRDGAFLLQPLTPKKPQVPLAKPSSKVEGGQNQSSLPAEPRYNQFAPWDFSDLILAQAEYYRGTPYCRGGSLQTGTATDCSGFVQYIYKGFKIDLPRSSAEQAQVGKTVSRSMDFSKMLPGDLLFFRRGGHIGHAGIYLGDGKMIHESNHRYGVTVTDLRQPYYEGTFVVAKRVFVVHYPD